MSKAPSVETQLKNALRDVRHAEKLRVEAYSEATRVRAALAEARGRETKALQEAAEWRKRFDDLLARVPVAAITTELSK